MRAILVFLLVAGCSGADDPHEVVSCESEWRANPDTNPFLPERCEAACAEKPSAGSSTCLIDGLACENAVTVDGAPGCCVIAERDGMDFVELRFCQ